MAPSCLSLNAMLHVCEEYAFKHDIVFNPDKTRCMHFYNGNASPGSVRFMNNNLSFVEESTLLGVKVLPDFKADIDLSVQQFRVKCMSMLLEFKYLSCDVLSKLLSIYCLDVYGSQLWDYECGTAETFYVAWRKAMRRIWKLSNLTHCSLLPVIGDCLSIESILEKRFVKFLWNCFNSTNMTIVNIVNIAMHNRKSVLGTNFRYLAFKYKIKSSYWYKEWCTIERCINKYVDFNRSDNDYFTGTTIRELCLTRKSIVFLSDGTELNEFIKYLGIS